MIGQNKNNGSNPKLQLQWSWSSVYKLFDIKKRKPNESYLFFRAKGFWQSVCVLSGKPFPKIQLQSNFRPVRSSAHIQCQQFLVVETFFILLIASHSWMSAPAICVGTGIQRPTCGHMWTDAHLFNHIIQEKMDRNRGERVSESTFPSDANKLRTISIDFLPKIQTNLWINELLLFKQKINFNVNMIWR